MPDGAVQWTVVRSVTVHTRDENPGAELVDIIASATAVLDRVHAVALSRRARARERSTRPLRPCW